MLDTIILPRQPKKVKKNIYNFFRIFAKWLLTNIGADVIMSTEIKGSDRTLEEANMDTTTLILVIIGAFTVSSWVMRLVDYLDGGKTCDV